MLLLLLLQLLLTLLLLLRRACGQQRCREGRHGTPGAAGTRAQPRAGTGAGTCTHPSSRLGVAANGHRRLCSACVSCCSPLLFHLPLLYAQHGGLLGSLCSFFHGSFGSPFLFSTVL